MLKEIIYSTISVVIIVWMMWFIIPMLKTVFNNEMLVVNATSPMVAPILPVANTWFLILPLFIPLVGGFIIVAYAVRNLTEDYF